ncbi:MAG: hypothetical protein LUD16_10405, partial [Lachnospiraceae bacterium]|nr:hypothetical protein [Lachnospiraceae bacterium]
EIFPFRLNLDIRLIEWYQKQGVGMLKGENGGYDKSKTLERLSLDFTEPFRNNYFLLRTIDGRNPPFGDGKCRFCFCWTEEFSNGF